MARAQRGRGAGANGAGCMTSFVIEAFPLVRLGIQRMLERMPEIGEVVSMEPGDITLLDENLTDAPLVVFGMSEDASDNWYLLRRLHRAMPAARILLLSDNMWLRVPSALQVCGVVEHLPRTASVSRMETAVRSLLTTDADRLPGPSDAGERQTAREL